MVPAQTGTLHTCIHLYNNYTIDMWYTQLCSNHASTAHLHVYVHNMCMYNVHHVHVHVYVPLRAVWPHSPASPPAAVWQCRAAGSGPGSATYMYMHVHAYTCTSMHACTCTNIHTFIHIHSNARHYSHTCTLNQQSPLPSDLQGLGLKLQFPLSGQNLQNRAHSTSLPVPLVSGTAHHCLCPW